MAQYERGETMHNAYIVTGMLTNERTVTLDEALPLPATKVRLVIEPLGSASHRSYQEIVAAIRERQAARGHRPPTTEEVNAYLQAERDSWEK
jgi:hypothetical protein